MNRVLVGAFVSLVLLASSVVSGCARAAYYGPWARNPSAAATLDPWNRNGSIFNAEIFQVTHVNGEPIPASEHTGTAGLKLYLDASANHQVTILASHPTPMRQTVATITVAFQPAPGREYIPSGKLENGAWTVWIADKASKQATSAPVTMAARDAAPIQGPDMGPALQAIMR
jgi:hypothetical protein